MKFLNHIPFFILLNSKACKEPSISSTFVMLNSISDDAKREWWKQSRARVRGVDKYKGNGVFKYNKGDKSKLKR